MILLLSKLTALVTALPGVLRRPIKIIRLLYYLFGSNRRYRGLVCCGRPFVNEFHSLTNSYSVRFKNLVF